MERQIKVCNGFKLRDPHLLLLKEKMVELLKLSVYQKVLSRDSSRKSLTRSYAKKEKDFADSFLKYTGKINKRRQYQLFKFDKREIKVEKSYSTRMLRKKVDLSSTKHILDQIDIKKEFSFLSELKTENQILAIFQWLKWIEFKPESKPAPNCKINSIDFKIDKVKCVEKVGEINKEEIEIGGVAIDCHGTESKIAARDVAGSNYFNDGKTKNLSPDWTFKKFTGIGTDYSESKIFMVTPFMAERDGQGFSEFLDDAYKAIKDDLDKIFKELGKIAGGIIGAKIGGTAGAALGGPIGAALGILAGLILGELISALIGMFEDDIFPGTDDHIALLSIDNPCFRFNGSSVSPKEKMIFERGGGRYEMTYYWKINGSIS